MAKVFEELECWQLAADLDAKVYDLVINGKINYSNSLKDQMLRSAGSIADNIAEGFERGGNKEFIQFLFIAKGSCGELRSRFHRSKRRGLIDEKVFEKFFNECRTVSVKLSNLISYLKKSDFKGAKYT
ncbi:four helix bundle protein [Aurantibacillus circumpalustris]|uniref:four helix bundle protein n=1 Tax=Aurantibacillus circumpalustris TaxID=3036359 RepID=UPI00295B757C|nr:four helix bundle protein [Aurantibacillus circumpalustris]